MEFSRVGKHTINCVITEDEITDLGFSVEEIVTNSERTQEFMNHIFDMAEQQFETKFDLGVKTVQVEFRSDHTLSLTFSEHPAAEGMMEHLRDIIGGLLNTIPQEKWEEYKSRQIAEKTAETAEENVVVLVKFLDMETAIRYAKSIQLERLPRAWLVKERDTYYLKMELIGYTESEVKRLSVLTDEYASDIEGGRRRWAYLQEHGKMILSNMALEFLREL